MKRVILAAVIMLGLGLVNAQADGGKKLIEWGWDEPNPKFMRENAAKMETTPFDGFVFYVQTDSGFDASLKFWGAPRLDYGQFSSARSDLKAAHFTKLTDRFLRLNVAPGPVDWFDDDQWTILLANTSVMARLAHESGAKGVLLDLEQYGDPVFDYQKSKYATSKTFDEHAQMVRQRGQEFMTALNAQYPDITVFLSFGYYSFGPAGAQRATNRYGLAANFLDGLLDAATDTTKIIDGWETSYYFTRRAQFTIGKAMMTKELVKYSENQAQYLKLVRPAFAVYMDKAYAQRGWDAERWWLNYFSPIQLQTQLEYAFEATDHYVWLYSEHPKWWTNENLSPDYIEAVRAARPK